MSSSTPHSTATPLKALSAFLTLGLAVLLTSCGSTPSGDSITVVQTRGFQPNHGPFDSSGNYIESWADKPPKRVYVSKDQYAKLGKKERRQIQKPPVVAPPRTQPVVRPEPRYVASTPPVKRPTYVKPTPKKVTKPAPKPKPKRASVAVKPKAKPPVVHKVKKGDTLYGLSRKYKSSIGAIQRANKLNSTHIGIGDRLIIPRK